MTVQLIVNYEGGGFGNAFGGGAAKESNECKFLCIIMNKETTKEKLPTYEENLVVERHEVEEVLQKQRRMQQNELAWCISKNIYTATFNFIYQSALVVVPQDVEEVCKTKR